MPAQMINLETFNFDARRDTIDFRDLMYTPTLVEVPMRIPLEQYKKLGVPILNQGQEGACTGFGLATIVHFFNAHAQGRLRPDSGQHAHAVRDGQAL